MPASKKAAKKGKSSKKGKKGKKSGKKGSTPVEKKERLTSAQLERIFRETFNALDTGRRGEIPVDLIGRALRMNNQCPSESELQKIIDDYTEPPSEDDIEPKAAVLDFEDFCTVMKENWKTKDTLKDEIDAAFATLDRSASNGEETGMISADNLRSWMLTLGETLEEAEVNEMIKEAAGMDGKISYDQFSQILLDAYGRPASKKKGKASGKANSKKGAKKK